MSLPSQAIDRLFSRLYATYGRDFSARWEGMDENIVKSSWAHELAGFAGHLESVAWALDNLPERAPNVIEFRSICRRAPAPEVPRIEVSAAGKERVAGELAKLGPGFRQPTGRSGGSKDWARRIVENDLHGIRSKSSLPLRMAKAALEGEA